MTSVTVKICGLKSEETVRAVRRLPIDHIGFVFAPSKRQVSAAQAGQLIAVLRDDVEIAAGGQDDAQTAQQADSDRNSSTPLAVGVFVNPTLGELEAVLKEAPLDILQLHGHETPEYCSIVRKEFGLSLFKFMPISALPLLSSDPADQRAHTAIASRIADYAESVEAILLDTHDPAVAGGSGKTFAWERIPPYLKQAHDNGIRLIVAGGLHAANVGMLIERYHPDGVDISSGVETNGEKDIEKIRMFVEQARSLPA